jgi:tetratricopeptide (TPR) repeat protein
MPSDWEIEKEDIDSLEKKFKSAEGGEWVEILSRLVTAYVDADEYFKAIKLFKECVADLDPVAKAEIVRKVSHAYEQSGDLEKAISMLKYALKEIDEGDHKERGWLFLRLAQILGRRGDFDDGMETCQLAITEFSLEGNMEDAEARAINTTGMILWEKGDYERARNILAQAAQKAESVDADGTLAIIHNNLGLANYHLGKYDEALRWFSSSLEYEERTGSKYRSALCFNNIGLVYHDRGDLDMAESFYNRALEVNEKIENFIGAALNLLNLGFICVDRGNPDEGRDRFEESVSICTEMGEKRVLALNKIGLTRVYLLKGDLKNSEVYARKALALGEEMDAKEINGMALKELGMIMARLGNFDKSEENFGKAIGIFRTINDRYEITKTYLDLGEMLILKGEKQWAREHLIEAQNIASNLGATRLLARARELLSQIED